MGCQGCFPFTRRSSSRSSNPRGHRRLDHEVVSIVFAILLMTLTLASMQFSPRIIVSFVRDRATQWTLGIFLGTFLYCMAALPAAHSLPQPFAPVAAVMGAILLAIICVGLLLFFIHHISQAISVNHIVDRIASETEVVMDDVMPLPRRQTHVETGDGTEPTWGTAIRSNVSGYIRFVDTKRLLALATSYHVKVNIVRRVGQFVPAGVPLIMVHKGERLSAESQTEFREAVDLGPARTFQQDVEFGVLQIVDIALKAFARRERPDHGDLLRRPIESPDDPFRQQRDARTAVLRSTWNRSRQYSMD